MRDFGKSLPLSCPPLLRLKREDEKTCFACLTDSVIKNAMSRDNKYVLSTDFVLGSEGVPPLRKHEALLRKPR